MDTTNQTFSDRTEALRFFHRLAIDGFTQDRQIGLHTGQRWLTWWEQTITGRKLTFIGKKPRESFERWLSAQVQTVRLFFLADKNVGRKEGVAEAIARAMPCNPVIQYVCVDRTSVSDLADLYPVSGNQIINGADDGAPVAAHQFCQHRLGNYDSVALTNAGSQQMQKGRSARAFNREPSPVFMGSSISLDPSPSCTLFR